MSVHTQDAQAAIAHLEYAAEKRANCVAAVMELEDARPLVKSRCIAAMIGTENPETQKPHSASSAEKIVESHPEYAEHRREQIAAEVRKLMAFGEYDAAKLRAQLAVGLAIHTETF